MQALWPKGIFLSQNAHATVNVSLLVLDSDTIKKWGVKRAIKSSIKNRYHFRLEHVRLLYYDLLIYSFSKGHRIT